MGQIKFTSQPVFGMGKDVACFVTFSPFEDFCCVCINKEYGGNRGSVGNGWINFIAALLCVYIESVKLNTT